MKIILFVTILLTISCNNSFASFSVSPSHPRILIKSDETPSLRKRCREVHPFKDAYQALKKRIDGWQSPSANRYLIGYEIQGLVLVSLIENYNDKDCIRSEVKRIPDTIG